MSTTSRGCQSARVNTVTAFPLPSSTRGHHTFSPRRPLASLEGPAHYPMESGAPALLIATQWASPIMAAQQTHGISMQLTISFRCCDVGRLRCAARELLTAQTSMPCADHRWPHRTRRSPTHLVLGEIQPWTTGAAACTTRSS